MGRLKPWRTGTTDCPANNYLPSPTQLGLAGGNLPTKSGRPAREVSRRRPNDLCVLRETTLVAVIILWRPCSNGVALYDDCRHLTAPLGLSYNLLPQKARHNQGRYSPMLSLTVLYPDKQRLTCPKCFLLCVFAKQMHEQNAQKGIRTMFKCRR